MNGRTAKQFRREMRRTVATDAIETINAQTQAINHQILPNLNVAQARLEQVDARVQLLERQVERLAHRLDGLERESVGDALRRLVRRP